MAEQPAATAWRLLESSPDCAKLLDRDGRLLCVNASGCTALELDDAAALQGRAWCGLWPAPFQETVQCAVRQALGGGATRFTAPCPTLRGTPRWWDVSVWPVPDGQGGVAAVVALSRDVTALQEARQEQAENAARLSFLLEATQVGYWELDLDTRRARTSPSHDRCFGYTAPVAEWDAEIFLRHVHPEDRTRVRATLEQSVARLEPMAQTFRVLWADGSLHWLNAQADIYRDARGVPLRLLGTLREVTARKRAEEEAREASQRALRLAQDAEIQRARLDALLQAAPAAICYADAGGAIVLANAGNRALWGDQPAARHVGDYEQWKGWWADGGPRHGQPLAPHEWAMARALAGQEVGGDVVDIEPFGAPGVRKTVLLRGSPIRDAQGGITGAVLAQIDITDRVRAEAGLRASEAKLRAITDAMPQMVWSTRPDGWHDYYNRQWYAFTGLAEGETDGEGWNGVFHPDDQARAWERWRHSLRTGEPYEIEYRLRHRSGQYRWVLGRALPVRDDTGRIIRWMGTCTDIHESRLAQDALLRSEESLRQADRRKDEFLAMLAHELRNPLAPIATAALLLRAGGADAQRVAKASAIISRQVQHMTDIVNDLLDVSRVTRGLVQLEQETFDLKDALRAAVEQVRPLVEARNHALSMRLGPVPLWVRGDHTRCTQMVANLLNNAAKYTPPGGHLALDSRSDPDGRVRVQVSDDGDGIDAALLPHVFELFTQAERTPDRAQGGLGIGLALVRTLAEMHGGRVAAQSAGRGQGSTFTLELPLAEAPARAEALAAPAADEPGAGAAAVPGAEGLRIALVDDNADAAQTLAALLQLHGHRVSVFGCAGELLRHGLEPPPQVCILDIGLPDMSGHELARRLRQLPGLDGCRLYALTGYGQAPDRAASHAAGFDAHFVKPVDPVELLGRL
ncbi:PAS domain-containing hybrid sensor histidine kinase/response regulator [Azohydromonas aeria]|uniref:PAS domain-containing hybrid sensor histidine kinase/response regulator n=1 Tax=Azohydromonas aeria TaxID=2590212 RepID=UPI0018DFF35E|nr:PAS domain S-box protein [Azohydromonas aeria]